MRWAGWISQWADLCRQMRRGVRLQRLFGHALARQLFVVDRQRRPDPEGIDGMIAAWVGGVRMDQDAEAEMVEHQPRHQGREDFVGEGDLVHRAIVRTYLGVIPAPEPHRKALTDPV